MEGPDAQQDNPDQIEESPTFKEEGDDGNYKNQCKSEKIKKIHSKIQNKTQYLSIKNSSSTTYL